MGWALKDQARADPEPGPFSKFWAQALKIGRARAKPEPGLGSDPSLLVVVYT